MSNWYSDAFSSDLSKAKTSNMTSNKGLAFKSFGDAFKDIGKSMQDDELHNKKIEAYDSQLKNDEADRNSKLVNQAYTGSQINVNNSRVKNDEVNRDNTKANTAFTNKQTENKGVEITANQQKVMKNAKDIEDTANNKTYENSYLSNEYKTEKEFDKNYIIATGSEPTPEAILKKQKYFQDRRDSNALKLSTGFQSYSDFLTKYPNITKNITGATAEKIRKNLDNKKASLNSLKNQKNINTLQNKIELERIKNQQNSSNKPFKYTKETGGKIKDLIKTSLGYDAQNFNLDKDTQKEFNKMVVEVSKISKDLKLEPNLAYAEYLARQKKANDVLGIRQSTENPTNPLNIKQ